MAVRRGSSVTLPLHTGLNLSLCRLCTVPLTWVVGNALLRPLWGRKTPRQISHTRRTLCRRCKCLLYIPFFTFQSNLLLPYIYMTTLLQASLHQDSAVMPSETLRLAD